MIKLGYLSVNKDYDINDVNLRKLTHINLAFATVVDLHGTVEFDVKDEAKLKMFIGQNPNVKFMLSIGGWGAGNFSEAVASEQNRANFIKTTFTIVENYNLDGVDLDWEYPGCDGAGISSSPKDKENFTALMAEFRVALDELEQITNKQYLLTFAAGAGIDLVGCVEIEELYKITDFMNLMTYDMGGSFNISGYHTSLYPAEECASKGGAYYVDLYHNAGYKKEKIVYGAAFYGRGGNDVAGIKKKIKGEEGLYFDYHEIKRMMEDEETRFFYNPEAHGAYIYDGYTFVSFDTPRTIKAKLDYVIEQGLLGIMFWEYTTDNTGELLETIINY